MKGYLYAIMATAIWSGNFIIARGMSDFIPPISLAFSRWAVAALVLLPFVLRSLIAERQIIRDNIVYLSVTGLLGVTTFNTLIYIAGHTTTAINLTLIAISFPIFIILLVRIFYGERIGWMRGCGILTVVSGVVLLITKGDISVLLNISFAVGDIWMLSAAFIFAVYNLLVKRKPQELSFWSFQLSTFLLGLLFLSPFFVWETLTTGPIEWNTTVYIAITYVGVFASLGAFGLWANAIFLIGPAKAGMLYYTLPLFSGIWAFLLLGEQVTMLHFFCVILILSGIIIANNAGQRRSQRL